MSAPPIPPVLEPLSGRPFSFYPPIRNIEHNEWRLQKATWSEIQVINAKTEMEVWIPRRFLGEVSSVDEPVMIVGLVKELEYNAGSVWPHERRVIEMPRAVNDGPPLASAPPEPPAPVVGIRFEPGPESRVSRLIGAALLLGVVIGIMIVAFSSRPVSYKAIVQSELGLTGEDDYHAIVRKLGPPAEDRWREDSGELQYRLLGFPGKPYVVILMGTERENARYIGALDAKTWKPVHSTDLPGGGNTLAMLRGLRRF